MARAAKPRSVLFVIAIKTPQPETPHYHLLYLRPSLSSSLHLSISQSIRNPTLQLAILHLRPPKS